MPETQRIVINTAPLIALVAALGDLMVLQSLYSQVLVPFEVCQEILVGGSRRFAVAEFDIMSAKITVISFFLTTLLLPFCPLPGW